MMATYDWSPVSVAYDKTSYAPGETITISVSGQVKRNDGGSTTDQEVLSQTLTAPDGSSVQISAQTVSVTKTVPGTVTNLATLITSVTGSGRTWTVAPNGLTATAVA